MSNDASIPGQFPAQDDIDRAAHVAFIVRLNVEDAYLQTLDAASANLATDELRSLFPQVINESIDEIFPQQRLPDFSSEHYQVGPMAGGIADLAHIMVMLVEQSDRLSSHLDDVPTYYFFYRVAVESKRRISDWVREKKIPGVHAVFAYTPEDLKLLAEGYTYELFGRVPVGRTVIHCLTKEFYGGYSSPAHPTESLEYLVIVSTGSGSYRYRVMGDSRILELVTVDDTGEHRIDALAYLDGEESGDDPESD